ncbi:hypothetical protein FQN54_007164 [Arachnomyces sp. PD_36]|nr:hypothetical protein FQN54_007164 [Arachnomyces sp. PD_36]
MAQEKHNKSDVEFKAMDGIKLRAWLYPSSDKGPGIIMTPGLNFPKNELYANVAQSFQRAGFTALVYDPRGVGLSEGMPRCDINPAKQAADFHDAVTFLKSQPTVDPRRIVIWGYSLSAAEGLVAATLDRRVKLVIAICPAIPLDLDNTEKCNRLLAQAMQDRESQARGNPPFCMPYLGDSDEGALFNFRKFRGVTHDNLDQLEEYVPNFKNEITIQTFYNIISWNFMDLLKFRPPPVPVFQVNAAEEELEHVKRNYGTIFDALLEPKEIHVEPNKGHIDILMDDDGRFETLMKMQIDFIEKHLGD